MTRRTRRALRQTTLDVAITVTNADSAQYKVDNGEWVDFSDIATATVGKDTEIGAYTTLTVSATTAPITTEPTTVPETTEPTTAPITTEPTSVPPVSVILGDVNGDKEVNVKDATIIQKVSAEILTLSAEYAKAADIDGDGSITIKDATFVQKYIAGISTGYNIGTAI